MNGLWVWSIDGKVLTGRSLKKKPVQVPHVLSHILDGQFWDWSKCVQERSVTERLSHGAASRSVWRGLCRWLVRTVHYSSCAWSKVLRESNNIQLALFVVVHSECTAVEMNCVSCLAENWFCMSCFLSLTFTKFCICLSVVRHWYVKVCKGLLYWPCLS